MSAIYLVLDTARVVCIIKPHTCYVVSSLKALVDCCGALYRTSFYSGI